ncbi:MAG: DsbA family oxidoreductase, partial [candidate division Zixibacteria bacterium]|nr:DsbA family oxidoreductase [Phycisphaerae bacterium]NIW41217.1 DsbA family oxidoreductase [candidate division Zixibacteria bacterium]NIX59653.1 DsbA family oxidoreductase [candidate division Zixibacteria bacterium]
MLADYDVDVEWRAFELHPEVPPEGMPLPPYIRANFDAMSRRLQEMAKEGGMEMVMSAEKMPNSRRALEAAEYAREKGCHEAFHRVVFRRFYGEGEDLGSWQMLRAAAAEVGLDPDEMQRVTEHGHYREGVDAQIAEARSMGIT